MKSKGSQFHPSRDKRPTEYGLPGGVYGDALEITGHGIYDQGDVANEAEHAKHEGITDHPLVQPMQGRLFDAEKHEAANRQKLGRERFDVMKPGEIQVTGELGSKHAEFGPPTVDIQAEAIRTKALQSSRIPTSHLQPRRGTLFTGETQDKQETVLTSENDGRPWRGSNAAGWYTGPTGYSKSDKIAIDPSSAGHGGTDVTFVHEAGHRRHLGETPAWDDRVTHPHGRQPDPLKEGVADAYADRYAGPEAPQVRFMKEDIDEGNPFASYSFTGYSTDREQARGRNWTTDDRALYAATRAHASETGEQAYYEPRSRHVMENPGSAIAAGGSHPTIDATLHGLMNAGPHAREAMKNADMSDLYAGDLAQAGEAASRRHMDRELLTQGQHIQQSMFTDLVGHESGKIYGHDTDLNVVYGNSESFDEVDKVSEQQLERQVGLEQQHGEMVFSHHMNKNQFGEKPRTTTDVQRSLGVSEVNAKKRGFPTR